MDDEQAKEHLHLISQLDDAALLVVGRLAAGEPTGSLLGFCTLASGEKYALSVSEETDMAMERGATMILAKAEATSFALVGVGRAGNAEMEWPALIGYCQSNEMFATLAFFRPYSIEPGSKTINLSPAWIPLRLIRPPSPIILLFY